MDLSNRLFLLAKDGQRYIGIIQKTQFPFSEADQYTMNIHTPNGKEYDYEFIDINNIPEVIGDFMVLVNYKKDWIEPFYVFIQHVNKYSAPERISDSRRFYNLCYKAFETNNELDWFKFMIHIDVCLDFIS